MMMVWTMITATWICFLIWKVTLLARDYVDEMESLMTSPQVRSDNNKYSLPNLLDSVCCFRAMKCANALLEEKLGITPDVNGHFMMHHVAKFLSPELVLLFLRHGARPDVRYYSRVMNNGLLPLHIALEKVRQRVSGDSIYKMIVALSSRNGLFFFNLLFKTANARYDVDETTCKLINGLLVAGICIGYLYIAVRGVQ
ncbi:hypothetical protein Vadar_031240 [Vaccinium darrowii]|uniref:Uncharacterized protein n=1 Tax=Vaccinium darrowii TaxID=229202 RepID=A0ACB7Y3Q9_9ERIC|nr:hypothetical protein Vadar_031240 [Vaccinium darrowii]